MEERNLVDTLLAVGVLAATDDDQISLSDEFRQEVTRRESVFEADAPSLQEFNERLADSELQFTDIEGVPPAILGIRAALDDRRDELSAHELRHALFIIDQLYRGLPHSGEEPESFFPVRGDQLKACLQLYPASIVYVWLEDCDPCELVRDDLDRIFPDPPDDIALFSVYGPDWSELLYESYDVVGGPVILFMVGETVDTRFTGVHEFVAVENEVDVFREIALPGEAD